MINKIENVIKKYNMITNNCNIIVGLSGGADSICLFHILLNLKEKYNMSLIPVHINHQLRGSESDDDQLFVMNFCKSFNIDCKVYKIEIKKLAKNLKISEEEAGRQYRYECFRKEFLNGKINKIAVAHTKNDNAETILMRIFRGTGTKGLCGIDIATTDIIRPLLQSSREDVEKYCSDNNLQFKMDSTNNLTIYTRNKIRLELIPYIKKNFNENIINTLLRSSKMIQEEQDLLNQLTTNYYNDSIIKNSENIISLNISYLKKQHIAMQKMIIRRCFFNINKNLVNINVKHVESIIKLIYSDSGKKLSLPFQTSVRISYNELIFTNKSENIQNFYYEIPFETLFFIKEKNFYITIAKNEINYIENKINTYTKSFSYDNISSKLIVRNRQSGDKIHLNKIGTKKIKDYFIDEKIDILERDAIPLLALDSDILWIMDEKNLTNDNYNAKENYSRLFVQIWEDIL